VLKAKNRGFLIFIALSSLLLRAAFCCRNVQAESVTEKTGDIVQVLIPATAYLTTFALDDKEGRNQFYKSFFVNLGVTHGLKVAINKQRPENHGDYSFPSGHTSASFQGAAFIHRRYGWKFAIPAYAAAAYVGWSRVEGESDKHDVTDVAAGAAIGVISSFYFTKPRHNLVVTPYVDGKTFGLSITKKW
jgi:membrane-associated phospholipid phosphatase